MIIILNIRKTFSKFIDNPPQLADWHHCARSPRYVKRARRCTLSNCICDTCIVRVCASFAQTYSSYTRWLSADHIRCAFRQQKNSLVEISVNFQVVRPCSVRIVRVVLYSVSQAGRTITTDKSEPLAREDKIPRSENT